MPADTLVRHWRPDPTRSGGRLGYAIGMMLAVVVCLAWSVTPAHAHAALVESSPFDGQHLTVAPDRAVFTFNEEVALTPGALRVYDTTGNRIDDGDQVQPGPNTVSVGLGDVADGGYVATYRVTSADGHVIRGALTFRVGSGGRVDDQTVATLFTGDDGLVPTLGTVVRIVGLAATLLAVGMLMAAAATPLQDRIRRRGGALAATVGGVAAMLTIPIHAMAMSGLGWTALAATPTMAAALTSSVGVSAMTRFAGLLVLYGVAKGPAGRRQWIGLVGGTALALGSLLVAGHTRTIEPAWVMLVGDAVHVSAAALWAGGLVALLLLLLATGGPTVARTAASAGDRANLIGPETSTPRQSATIAADDRDDPASVAAAVASFSRRALWSMVALTVSGGLMGWALVRQPRALVSTDYGWVLLAKVGLVAVIVVLAAYNRFRLVPAVQSADRETGAARRQLTSTMRLEAILLGLVLVMTGVLVNLRPAADAAGITGAFDTVVSVDQDTSVNVVIDPNRAGVNQIHVYALDATGQPTSEVSDVTLELTQVAADIGPIVRSALPAGPGHWVYSGPDLAIPGPWQVVVVLGIDRFTQERVAVEVVVNE